MRLARVILPVPCLLCLPAMVSSQGVSFGGSFVYATLEGNDYAGINGGVGFDVQARYHVSRGFSVGGGLQYTTHGVEGQNEDFHVRGFFADARYAFAPASTPKVRPYLGGRFAATRWNVAFGGGDAAADGTALGPTGGLLIRIGSVTQLDVGLAWMALKFGDAKLNGAPLADSNTSGSALALRLGFVVGSGVQ